MQETGTAGATLKKAREDQGYVIADVSHATLIDGSLISRWENGKNTDMQVYQLVKLVQFLGLDLREIAGMLARDDAAKRARDGTGRKTNDVQIYELANLADMLGFDLTDAAMRLAKDEDAKRAKEKRRVKSDAARAAARAAVSTEDAAVALEADSRRRADLPVSGTPQARKRRPAS